MCQILKPGFLLFNNYGRQKLRKKIQSDEVLPFKPISKYAHFSA